MEELRDQFRCRLELKRHSQVIVCMIVKGLSAEVAVVVDALTLLPFVLACIRWSKMFVELCTRSAVCFCLYYNKDKYLWRVQTWRSSSGLVLDYHQDLA